MMKKYENPRIDILICEVSDVIATSGKLKLTEEGIGDVYDFYG